MLRTVVLASVIVMGCRSKPARHDLPKTGSATVASGSGGDPCANAKPHGPLAWIDDDYASALACAKQKKVPLVLDLWAPWCHTCLSMQTTVLIDPSFTPDNKRFVFAALDTDREDNAPALARLAISAWPTYYVIGDDETVMARFVGAASIAQFHNFLDAGARAVIGGVAAADAHLLGADRALAVKDLATADTELAATIAAAPAAWSRRPEVLGSWILTKYKRGDLAGCIDVANQYMSVTGNAAVASDFLVTAVSCADGAELAEKSGSAGSAAALPNATELKTVREHAVARWKELLADTSAQLSVDDRSDAMASLRETMATLGDKAGAKAIAEQQKKLLDDAAAHAPTPLAAMTYNWPRAEVYVFLGTPLDLVPALEKSAKDLPTEYDPPARLGWLYFHAGKLPEAATWTDKSLALAYGPRKARMLGLRADIAAGAGDKPTERKFRELTVQQYENLPRGQENQAGLDAAKAALTAMDRPVGSGSAK